LSDFKLLKGDRVWLEKRLVKRGTVIRVLTLEAMASQRMYNLSEAKEAGKNDCSYSSGSGEIRREVMQRSGILGLINQQWEAAYQRRTRTLNKSQAFSRKRAR
jgi:hypothetical protein